MAGADDVQFDRKIVAKKIDRKIVVGGNASNLCGGVNHDLWPIGLKPSNRRLFLGEIHLMSIGEKHRAILRREAPHDSRTDHAAMAGHKDPLSGKIVR
jgi:hypothetical protein